MEVFIVALAMFGMLSWFFWSVSFIQFGTRFKRGRRV